MNLDIDELPDATRKTNAIHLFMSYFAIFYAVLIKDYITKRK